MAQLGPIVLATYRAGAEPTPSDRLVAAALEERGLPVQSAPWDSIRPEDYPGALVCLRSTWDYHLRPAEFREWVGSFGRTRATLWNPPATVLWNLDKAYLQDLEQSGIPIPPTRWLRAGNRVDLGVLFGATGWPLAVLKPRVSASAHGTILVGPDSVLTPEDQARLSASGALLQQFVPQIQTRGEVSLMFLDGEYSHAASKEVAAGEFRVQPHLGGVARRVEATAALRAFGARVLAAVPEWRYARVDVVEADRGPLLMEVELIEPELFFTLAPEAAHRFADLLARGCAGSRGAMD